MEPLAITVRSRETDEQYARILHILTSLAWNAPAMPSSTALRNNGASDSAMPPAWRHQIDLAHNQDEDVRPQVLEILQNHESMWNGEIGTVRAMEHRIELQPGPQPVRAMPYGQGLAMQKHIKLENKEMLAADFIELASSRWASTVFLAPRKDGTLRLGLDYRRLNTKTLLDTYRLLRYRQLLRLPGRRCVFLSTALQVQLPPSSACGAGHRENSVYYAPPHVPVQTDALRAPKGLGYLSTCSRRHSLEQPVVNTPYISRRRSSLLQDSRGARSSPEYSTHNTSGCRLFR